MTSLDRAVDRRTVEAAVTREEVEAFIREAAARGMTVDELAAEVMRDAFAVDLDDRAAAG